MTRSLNEADLSELEDQLRDALRKRAASTPVAVGSTPMPAASAQPSTDRGRRGALVLAVAAVVALVFGAIQLVRSSGEVRTTTAQEGPSSTEAAGPTTAAPAPTVLPGAEVPRLLVDGAELIDTEPDAAYPLDGESEMLQAFRRPGRLDGPMIFLYTVRDLSSWGLVTDEHGDPVELRGLTGYVAHGEGAEGSTTMSVDLGDGTALYLIATGLTDDELAGFVDALDRPGPDDPWISPAGPQGVTESPVAPPPADGRVYSATFSLPDPPAGPDLVPGREHGESGPQVSVEGHPDASMEAPATEETFELNLYQDGFESRLADRVASTTGPVEMVEVGGIPAAVGAYDDLDWWVMMEPEQGRTLEFRIGNNRETVDWVIEHARFVDEATWDDATGG